MRRSRLSRLWRDESPSGDRQTTSHRRPYSGPWTRPEPRWRTPIPDDPPAAPPEVVGVDISGRHEEAGGYLMVAAAVHASVDSARIRSVHGMGFARSQAEPELEETLAVVADALDRLPAVPNGPVVAERGEFYEVSAERIGFHFRPEFKYVETISERETVQAAHYAAYGVRELMVER